MRLGDYEVEGELGRGGMGVVYRARHVPTGALRAVKVLRAVADPEILARFRREAEALARVGGGGVVPVHEVGVEKGRLYVVLGLMPGGSLEARLKARGRFEWPEAAALVAKLARALERCHAAGIVHRDVKPSNVLFDEEDRPCLADFGVARDLAAASLTETGALLGTPAFMPPEQLEGRRVGPQVDVYALGAMLHLLVAGELPFKARAPYDLLLEKKRWRPEPASAARGTSALDGTIARALAPDPAERTASASELARALEAALEAAKAAGAVTGAAPRRGRSALLVAAAAVLLALGVVAALRLQGRLGPEETARPELTRPAAEAPDARFAAARAKLAGSAPVTSADAPFELVAASSAGAAELRALAARRAIPYARADAERLRALYPGEDAATVLAAIAALGGTPEERATALEVLAAQPKSTLAWALARAAACAEALVAPPERGLEARDSVRDTEPLVAALGVLEAAPRESADLAVAPLTSRMVAAAIDLAHDAEATWQLANKLKGERTAENYPRRFRRACVILASPFTSVGSERAAASEEVAAEAQDDLARAGALAHAVDSYFFAWRAGTPFPRDRCERDALEVGRLRPAIRARAVVDPVLDEGLSFALRRIAWMHALDGLEDRAEALARGAALARESLIDFPDDPYANEDLLRFLLEQGSDEIRALDASRFETGAPDESFDLIVLRLEAQRRTRPGADVLASIDEAARRLPPGAGDGSLRLVRALVLADLRRFDDARAELEMLPPPSGRRPVLSNLTRDAAEHAIDERDNR